MQTELAKSDNSQMLTDVLKLSSTLHRSLLNLVRTPVMVIRSGRICYVNPALCDLVEKCSEELLETDIAGLLHERARSRVVHWIESRYLTGETSFYTDLRLETRNGEFRWVNAHFVAAEWEGFPAVVGFLSDIEERKRNQAVEEQLRQSQKMEAVGRLAGGVAHDMNNLLGAIMGFASVLQVELEPECKMISDVNHILEACKKGRDLMLNLLGFARRGKYRLERFTLNERVEEVIKLLKHSISKKIIIDTRLDGNPLQIHGDPTQIHHAVMNICINAVDAMGESGTLTIITDILKIDGIEAPLYPDLGQGAYARLRVADTGGGMPQEVMDMAFEPFFTTKPQGKGSGLGLPMVYGTVKNHGGAVALESSPNEGTVVTMLLPLNRTPSGAFKYVAERRTSSSPSLASVLLVDDEEMIRKAGKRLLEKLGYNVLLAEDGREGLRLYLENRDIVSAVMLDLVMPVMDGEETLYKLREIDEDIPVLLSSGYSKEEKAEQLMARGADGFIQKPFDLDTLKKRLSELLKKDP